MTAALIDLAHAAGGASLRVRLLAWAALAWMLIPRPGLAQGYRQYLALLDGYASGEATEAATALAAWSEDRVRAAVRALERELLTVADGDGLVRTAVMLHTEAAFVEDADGRESFHLDVARSLVRRLLGNPRVGPAVRDFAARWHAQAAAQYCIRNDPLRARLEVNRGLTVDRNHPYVNLVAGALVEYGVVQEEPNPRGTWNIDGQRAYNLKNRLHQAAQTYRGIIATRPDFYEARLRLGWVLALNDSLDNGREQLEMVASRAPRADLSYLAHLFLGSLDERANRPAEAARAYEAARAAGAFQSSLIALMRIAGAHGEHERVRALAGEISDGAAADREDPWIGYRICVTGGELLNGLRGEAQRR